MKSLNTGFKIKVGQYLVLASLIGVMLSPSMANVFIGFTLFWTLAFKDLRHTAKNILLTKIGLAFLFFLTIILSAPIYAIASELTTMSSIWGWRKILMFPLAAIYFFDQPDGRSFVIKVFFIACVIFATISFLNLFFYHGNGIFIRNYVMQGLMFSIGTVICLSKLIDSKISLHKYFYLLIGLAFVLNIAVISVGRSGYVALIVMLFFFLLMLPNINSRKKLLFIGIFTTIICTVLILTPQSRDRIKLAYTEALSGSNQAEHTSVGLRITFWKNSFEMTKESSLFGVGTGGFYDAYKKQVKDKQGFEGVLTNDPHNQYLKILIEQGILGITSFLLLLTLFFLKKNNSDPNHIIGKSTLIAWCITSLANSHFSTFNEGQFIWIWLGIFLTSNLTVRQR